MTRFANGSHGFELLAFLDAIAVANEDEVDYTPLEKADELRYTFGPMYAPGAVDAHDEFATDEDLRKALWDFSLNGDKSLRKQHGPEKIGDIVELVQWPFEQEVELTVPGSAVRKVKLPAGTVYAGAHWTPEAWPDVKTGKITGYSMGGRAVRIRNLPDEGLVKLR